MVRITPCSARRTPNARTLRLARICDVGTVAHADSFTPIIGGVGAAEGTRAFRALANEPLPPTEERQHTEQDRCKFLMAKAAQQPRDISEALHGRSWVQRKKLKEITGRIEAISEELEQSWQESKPSVNESVGPS